MQVKPLTKEERRVLELWKRGDYTTLFSLIEKTTPQNLMEYLKKVDPKLEYVEKEKSFHPNKTIEEIAKEVFGERVRAILSEELEKEVWEKEDEIWVELKGIFDRLGVKYDIGQITNIFDIGLDTKEVALSIENVKIEPYKSDKETIFPTPYFVGDGLVYWSPNVGIKHISLTLGLFMDNEIVIGLGYGGVEKAFYLRWYKNEGWQPIEWESL